MRDRIDADVNTNAVAALFDKIGPGVLVTHSQSGGLGWRVALKTKNIRAIVSYEPGGDFVFPEGNAPVPVTLGGRTVTPRTVPMSDFMPFTRIPIVIYYGDNIQTNRARIRDRNSGAPSAPWRGSGETL